MSETPLQPHSIDDLQFTTAEPGNLTSSAAVPGQNCLLCDEPITSTYFALGDKVLCPTCCERATAPVKGSRLGRLIKASLLGLGAGLIGALIWFAIRRVAHLEIGLVAILVGFMVGKAVRIGSGNRGGLGYQILAVVLTYTCIAANYMPDIIEAAFNAAREKDAAIAANSDANAKTRTELATMEATASDTAVPAAAGAARTPAPPMSAAEAIGATARLLLIVFGLSLAAPFLAGAQNLIGLIIIGFALWEAWRFNARRPLPISGPYRVAPPAAV